MIYYENKDYRSTYFMIKFKIISDPMNNYKLMEMNCHIESAIKLSNFVSGYFKSPIKTTRGR